jgi:hypothetical protein
MTWMVTYIIDIYKLGGLTYSDMSLRMLAGKTSSGGGAPKGLLDIVLLKGELLQELVRMSHELFMPVVAQKIQEMTASVALFRKHIGCSWSKKPVAGSFQAASVQEWTAACDIMVRMMEACVFSAEYDEVFSQALQNKKSLGAQLQCSPLKDLLEEVREAA